MGAITAELVDLGERRGAHGRRVTPADRREQLMAEYRTSGLTMAAFAKREGIKYPTFAGWMAKTQQSTAAKPPIRFTEMRLPLCGLRQPARKETTRWKCGCRTAPWCAVAWRRRWWRWCGRCGAEAMLAFPAAVRIYVAVQPVDMRKSFNGLWAAASEQLHEDPKSGAVFAFINRERTRLKLLYWDGTGVWILAKRLEQGRFSWPAASDARPKLSLAPEALALLIGGIELKHGSLKAWYERQ